MSNALEMLVGEVEELKRRLGRLEVKEKTTDTSTFVGLTDTPADYSGAGSKTVKVNAAANALEFVTVAVPAGAVTSLLNDQTQDDITGSTSYQDCSGTASITVTETSTIVVQAHFKLRTSHVDYQAAVKLVDSADTNIGTTIATSNETYFLDWSIYARLPGKAAGTYTYNLMANIAHTSQHCYVDEKQILITANTE